MWMIGRKQHDWARLVVSAVVALILVLGPAISQAISVGPGANHRTAAIDPPSGPHHAAAAHRQGQSEHCATLSSSPSERSGLDCANMAKCCVVGLLAPAPDLRPAGVTTSARRMPESDRLASISPRRHERPPRPV